MKRQILGLTALVVALTLTGCIFPFSVQKEDMGKAPGADELFKEAEARFNEKSYDKAIELYERLKSAHRDFDKIAEVYLRIADALYEKGENDKAVARYHQFMELFPAHKEIPRAKYNVAMSYFKQFRNVDLDNRIITGAAEAFKAIRDNPDAGEWAKKAGEKYDECQKRLAEKELNKAKTYVSMGRYASAKTAAKRVLDEYGKLGFDKQAEDLLKSLKGK
ncbi:MAG: outer membrane protein assembly factor BamD [Deltaproteobacteria bacterium]|nr:outer membrane protein assembly factor BamD [Deltaproteobacteria bacterium]